LIATLKVLSQLARSESVQTVTVTVPEECEADFTYHILLVEPQVERHVNRLLSIASASQASQLNVNVVVEA